MVNLGFKTGNIHFKWFKLEFFGIFNVLNNKIRLKTKINQTILVLNVRLGKIRLN